MTFLVDHLPELAAKARARVKRGYYDNGGTANASHRGLVKAIQESKKTPVITEIKYASPSAGKIRESENPLLIAKAMLNGGACALSVLTDPENFDGNLDTLVTISKEVQVPTIMKDIVVSPKQLQAGRRAGASAVVFISEIFSRKLSNIGLDSMILEANRLGLEVLVEANSASEFESLRRFRPDLYGINNRNLSTFQLDLSTTEKILAENVDVDRPIVSESGIESPRDIIRLKAAGAEAFLVGTSIMRSFDIEGKVRELVNS
ncbi:indole-3-glycerol-phosphate synthase [Candidatus Bathyarchaeota archaeon]|nr:MAG: indole-3-glycerol-phosphate synthase [Candidatus Bathyarchaeota archaeon]